MAVVVNERGVCVCVCVCVRALTHRYEVTTCSSMLQRSVMGWRYSSVVWR